MIIREDIEQCRRDMQTCIGKRVRLRSSGGRRRVIVREGVLESCYPNVFTVRCRRDGNTTELLSYSYVDILTDALEVAVRPDEDLAALGDRTLYEEEEEADVGTSALPFETDAQ